MWTELDGMGPAWHRFVVVKQLNRRGKDPYTHDAHVYGDSAKHKRGVRLSMAAHEAGCWIGIAPASTAWSVTPSPDRSLHLLSVLPSELDGPPTPGREEMEDHRKRKRTAVQPFRVGDNTDGLASHARSG